MSRDGVLSPESHRLTTPGFTPRAFAKSIWDHSSFVRRARRRSAAGIDSAMHDVLTNDNYLSSATVAGLPSAPVASWQNGDGMSRPTFAQMLGSLSRAKRVNQSELAYRVGVDRGVVSRWCDGSRLPSGQDLLAICKVLGVTDPWVLMGASFVEPKGPREGVARPGRRPKATQRKADADLDAPGNRALDAMQRPPLPVVTAAEAVPSIGAFAVKPKRRNES